MQTDFDMKEVSDGFTVKELSAMHETELFRLKYMVIDKVVVHFSHLSPQVRGIIERYPLPEEIAKARVRIFRGDNYKLLPYAVMDYPALYTKEDSFAYRTMFWWGNFFSFTLYLHGAYFDMYRKNLENGIRELKGKDFYLCVNQTPWQYHYEKDNYVSLDEIMSQKGFAEKYIHERDFIKLSRHIKINEWEKTSQTCIETLDLLLTTITA